MVLRIFDCDLGFFYEAEVNKHSQIKGTSQRVSTTLVVVSGEFK